MASTPSSDDAKSFIRNKWVAGQMKDRHSEFTTLRALNFFCGTWNVNARRPDPDEVGTLPRTKARHATLVSPRALGGLRGGGLRHYAGAGCSLMEDPSSSEHHPSIARFGNPLSLVVSAESPGLDWWAS